MLRSFLIFGLVAGFIPTLQAQDKPALKPAEVALVVPIELLPSRHFVVLVKLNDKGPYRLILDTGAR